MRQLGAFSAAMAEIKKAQRYLLEEHLGELREIAKSQREKLIAEAVPEVA